MFGKEVNDLILARALETKEEICGVIIQGQPVFLPNEAEDRIGTFEIKELPEEAEAIFHSHPGGPFYPSVTDIRQQIATDIPWGIACFAEHYSDVFWFGASAPKQTLIGRGFRHYVSDCYSLIEDFYEQVHATVLPKFPREWEWWNNGETLYNSGFAQAGFKQIPMDEMQPGDAFLATIRSHTPNHAGVYLGDGLILHHTTGRHGWDPTRLSTVEPAARWFNFLDKGLRYEKDDLDRTVGQRIWP